ncbi:hypothetical protein AB1Y20_005371 [Prymnesium parvum]|uniref:Uncharacterized protein n=1 Tax=Prymnesium parvum TaxID=97485 RepID=A0AB34J5M2_PRYPA
MNDPIAPVQQLPNTGPALNSLPVSMNTTCSAIAPSSSPMHPPGSSAVRIGSVLHDEVAGSLRAAVAAAESVEKAASAAASAARQALNDYLMNAGPGAKKRKRKRAGDMGDLGDDGGNSKPRVSYAARKWYDFQDVCRLGSMIESGEIREGQELHEKDEEQRPKHKVPYSSMKFWLKDDYEVMRQRGGGGVKGMRHWQAERDLRGRTHLTPPGFAPGSRPSVDKANKQNSNSNLGGSTPSLTVHAVPMPAASSSQESNSQANLPVAVAQPLSNSS